MLQQGYVLQQGFQEFFHNNLFSDVKLVFKDNQFLFLHKLILAASSNFFKDCLEIVQGEGDDSATIFLPDFDVSENQYMEDEDCDNLRRSVERY